MKEWNVVVTVYDGGYSKALRLLEQFGPVSKTAFYNILLMRTADERQLLESLRELAAREPDSISSLARVMPIIYTFTFQSPMEFETKARQTVSNWLPSLAGKGFHLRMHRRGFKGKLSSMDEERFLDQYLLDALTLAGTPGHIDFANPDAVIALETIGPQAGLSLWTRADLQRYPLLHLD
jgi:tRNA(Ser,Leu) C12 N-acetylase TAN1